MSERMVELLVTALLSGGLATALATLITSRALAGKTAAEAKGLEARLPAEVDSVVVQGAEAAVLAMRSALESASGRIADLERDRAADRQRIEDLERKVDELRAKVEKAERALGDARQAGAELRAELSAFARDRDRR